MNLDQHHTGPGQPHSVLKASKLSASSSQAGSVSGKSSRFSCYFWQEGDVQHNRWVMFKVKSCKMILRCKNTTAYLWSTHFHTSDPGCGSWLFLTTDRLLWCGDVSHWGMPQPWKLNIIHSALKGKSTISYASTPATAVAGGLMFSVVLLSVHPVLQNTTSQELLREFLQIWHERPVRLKGELIRVCRSKVKVTVCGQMTFLAVTLEFIR